MSSYKILIAGIYLADQPNAIEPIVREFSQPGEWHVTQRWIAVGLGPASRKIEEVTHFRVFRIEPKFILLNRLLTGVDLNDFDFIVFCDDDVKLEEGFLKRYVQRVQLFDFALAQPARTHESYKSHPFVERLEGIQARWTRFVEIGPLFSMRRDLYDVLLPFDESSPMGWGYDFVWPCVIERVGLRLGIVDETPVDHSLRAPVQHYDVRQAFEQMNAYLARFPHLSKNEAFRILESYV